MLAGVRLEINFSWQRAKNVIDIIQVTSRSLLVKKTRGIVHSYNVTQNHVWRYISLSACQFIARPCDNSCKPNPWDHGVETSYLLPRKCNSQKIIPTAPPLWEETRYAKERYALVQEKCSYLNQVPGIEDGNASRLNLLFILAIRELILVSDLYPYIRSSVVFFPQICAPNRGLSAGSRNVTEMRVKIGTEIELLEAVRKTQESKRTLLSPLGASVSVKGGSWLLSCGSPSPCLCRLRFNKLQSLPISVDH